MSQSCCQTSQSHCPVVCGLIKKFYNNYYVVFMCHKCNAVMSTEILALQQFTQAFPV